MKVKNYVLESLLQCRGLRNLFESANLPIHVSFRIAKLVKALEEASTPYLQTKQKLISRHSNNGKIDNPSKFQGEMEKLLNEETELVGVDEKIKLRIKDIPSNVLSPKDILTLQEVFDFVEEDKDG